MSNIQTPTLIKASQINDASDVLGRAFFDDPMMKYIIPNDTKRKKWTSWYLHRAIWYGYLHGEVYVTTEAQSEEVRGVAVWLTPDKLKLTVSRMFVAKYSALLTTPVKFGPNGFIRMLKVESYSSKLHERSISDPHWYLYIIGVDPLYQKKGIGSSLLQPILQQTKLEKTPCFLKTENENNIPFYRRLGFDVVTEGQVRGGPKMWGMLKINS